MRRIMPSKAMSIIYSFWNDINGSVTAKQMKIAMGIQTIESRKSVRVSGPLLRLL